ncbi:MAG: helix-turn-helix domain-containing protein [Deltaproteobacteria bacterium]|nr:helix-turn-helix domain-containing protein [Deltaproteobacteria bacterium]
MANGRYLTIPELAKFLGVSRIAVYNRVKKGQIPAKKVGRTYIIMDQTIENILGKKITKSEKKWIDSAVHKTVQEYREFFKMPASID